jgi:hypothetical protein
MFFSARQVYQMLFRRFQPKVVTGFRGRLIHKLEFHSLNELKVGIPGIWSKFWRREFRNASSGEKYYTEMIISKKFPCRLWWFSIDVRVDDGVLTSGTLVMSFGHRSINQIVTKERARQLDSTAEAEEKEIQSMLDDLGV